MRQILVGFMLVAMESTSGCAIEEVRSRTEAGVEMQHSGTTRTDSDRYSIQPGMELRWDNGVTTGVKYRRRDVDDGSGNNDNGVWMDVSIPLWKARKKPEALAKQVEELERRVTSLERKLREAPNHAQQESDHAK